MVSSYVTTVVAFVLDVSFLVLLTVSDSVNVLVVLVVELAFRAHLIETTENIVLLLLLKLLDVGVVAALFEPAEEWVSALVALVIVKMLERKLLKVVIVLTISVL